VVISETALIQFKNCEKFSDYGLSSIHLHWGEQKFNTLPILQVFLLTKHVEVCHFYHRYSSNVNLKQKSRKSHCMIFN